jgi:DNA polymerase-3 subunit delta'
MKQLYGFKEIEEKLQNAFYGGKLHHCNMLVSEEGTGKLSFLKEFSSLVLGEKDGIDRKSISQTTQEQNYSLIEGNGHTDFAILNMESFLSEKDQEKKIKGEISIAQVGGAISLLQNTPLISKNKALIIDSIDKVNTDGQNALLKTLEEPTKNTFIFLVCNNKEKVLRTIFSRCCVHYLGKLSLEDWGRGLLDNLGEEISGSLDEDDMEKLYVISNQSIRLAIDITSSGGFDLYEDILKMFVNKDMPEMQKFCENIDKNKELFDLFKTVAEIFFHDLIHYSVNLTKNKIVSKNEDLFMQLARRNPLGQVLESYRAISAIIRDIDVFNMSKKHCLEVIFSNYL